MCSDGGGDVFTNRANKGLSPHTFTHIHNTPPDTLSSPQLFSFYTLVGRTITSMTHFSHRKGGCSVCKSRNCKQKKVNLGSGCLIFVWIRKVYGIRILLFMLFPIRILPFEPGFRIRMRNGSGFNHVSGFGSVFGIRIRIQVKYYPQKQEKN